MKCVFPRQKMRMRISNFGDFKFLQLELSNVALSVLVIEVWGLYQALRASRYQVLIRL